MNRELPNGAVARASQEAAPTDFGALLRHLRTRGPGELTERFRAAIKDGRERLAARFEDGVCAERLVRDHAALLDEVLVFAWDELGLAGLESIALVAVGGYGRRELHPGSDIDLLIVREGPHTDEPVQAFVRFLWDIGLDIGASVRTLEECVSAAAGDITIATNLMEARLLAGSRALFERMCERTGPGEIWPSKAFFEAKWEEQRARHRKHHDTAHNLEPNIKEGPGGLRDIQMIGWVAKRHFGADTLHELVTHEFLTEAEFDTLAAGQRFLWQIRFALHLLAGRREERLLFDHQLALARSFGYRDTPERLGVEQFMKEYYRTIMELRRLNEMLLELFQEAILYGEAESRIEPINDRFRSCNGFLECNRASTFRDEPLALLELFLVMQQREELSGVRASTIRLVRDHRYLIDEALRRDPRACELFLCILRERRALTRELRRMHRYGVLGAYLPAFGAIEGQMQYDLFHAYTVDEHTLFVVRNLRRFALPEHRGEFPLCSEIFARLPKPELAYLAALFHDIAKGRGGDHSELGADEAAGFCLRHGMSQYDTRIVAWLVKHHLLMSVTAQRRDISDPEVVNAFASAVGDQLHLDYLYLLTVADIRGTNPKLWNDWKDTLLRDLYEATQYALARGLENPIGRSELIRDTQDEARRLLLAAGLREPEIDAVWADLGENYFLQADPEEIAWHTRAIAGCREEDLPLVWLRSSRGGTEVCVYARDRHGLFALIVSTLDGQGLTILHARITTAANGMALDSFVVLDEGGERIDEFREQQTERALREQLKRPSAARGRRRRPRRQLKHFSIPTQIKFAADPANDRTMMEVVTTDRPGLLSRIGWTLVDAGASLQTAKIATFGERAEDMFYICDRASRPLSEAACEELAQRLRAALDADAK